MIGWNSRVSVHYESRDTRVDPANLGRENYTHAGLKVHARAVLGHALSVRLHVTLLEVVGELLHVLVVRQERLGLGAYG